jgi:hypothetical protein
VTKGTLVVDFLPFPIGSFVSVTKLSASRNPVTNPGDWETYVPGGDNIDSLPVDYTMKGFLTEIVQVGECIHLDRTERNGITAEGEFTSTTIVRINAAGSSAETFNSIYFITRTDLPGGHVSPTATELPPAQSASTMVESATL